MGPGQGSGRRFEGISEHCSRFPEVPHAPGNTGRRDSLRNNGEHAWGETRTLRTIWECDSHDSQRRGERVVLLSESYNSYLWWRR